MTVLALLVKLVSFWTLFGWLIMRFLTWSRRRWGFEKAFAITFILAQYSAALYSEALDHLPRVGAWFRLLPGFFHYFDPSLPLESLAGFLIVYGSVSIAVAVLYLIVFTQFVHVSGNAWWGSVLFWTAAMGWASMVQNWAFGRIGLPPPADARLPLIWSAVAEHVSRAKPGRWQKPVEVLACFLLMYGIAALGRFVCRSRREPNPHPYSRLSRIRRSILLWASVIFVAAFWHFGTRLADYWKPGLASTRVIPTANWMIWYGFVLVVVLVAVRWSARAANLPLVLDARDGGRMGMTASGLLWSLLGAVGVAAAEAYIGHWNLSFARAIPSPVLIRYVVILAAQAAAVSILVAYVAQAVVLLYGPKLRHLSLAAVPYFLLFQYAVIGWKERIFLLLLGLFLGYLYWFTQAIWAPIVFQIGWWLMLGPLFGFTVAPLQPPGWMIRPVAAVQTTHALAATGGMHAMIPAMIMSLMMVVSILLLSYWNELPKGGSY